MFIPIIQYTLLTYNKTYLPNDYILGISPLISAYIKYVDIAGIVWRFVTKKEIAVKYFYQMFDI